MAENAQRPTPNIESRIRKGRGVVIGSDWHCSLDPANIAGAVKRMRHTVIVGLSMFALFSTMEVAEAGPFANFFRRLRNSMTQPAQKRRSQQSTKRNVEAKPAEGSSPGRSPAVINAPPNKENTRTTKAALPTKEEKGDLRYGIPVPGKQGFVTSPFAPESGYIDVHSFPPGTPVKDPYTGKVFLTP